MQFIQFTQFIKLIQLVQIYPIHTIHIQFWWCGCLMLCAVDCNWEQISEWSACSASCGGGRRRRRIKIRRPKHGGLQCLDEYVQEIPINYNDNANLFDEFDMQQEEDCNTWQCKGGWFSQWNYAVCTLWGGFHTYIQRNTFYWKCFFAHWHVYFQFMDVW